MRDRLSGLRHGTITTLLAIVVSIGAATAGCARARAATQPVSPALDAPPPPPRVITPVEVEAAIPEPVPEEQLQPRQPLPQPPPPRPAPARTEPPRPAPPARVESEPAKPEEPRPNRTLQTPESGTESARAIRDQLARASANLQKVKYQSLSPNLKEQYDVAKRFMEQSEEALKAGNLVYAATLAGKALEIAEFLPR
jgi:type IV secretory pathway VirB10-like protein